jgi:hypothetical protein
MRQRPGRLAPSPVRDENRAAVGPTPMGLGALSPCDSVALEPVEPLIAAMSAKVRLIPGRLLLTAHLVTLIEERLTAS